MSSVTLHDLRAVVVDIEGTTTPISFVYDVLFPFARSHARRWLEENLDTKEGCELLTAFQMDARADREQGVDVPSIPDDPSDALEPLVQYVEMQMDADAKNPALKSMQGKVWISGYESGELRGVVWPDVVEAFERWTEAGKSVWIYSSGSVAAQKLLFGNSDQGDLLRFIEGHFDVGTGPKKEASSYEVIAAEIGVKPSELLFATDNLDEARAADEAGWNVVVLRRPGNPEVEDHPFVEAETFDELP